MLSPAYTKQFGRDTKRMKKRGKNLDKLKIIIRALVEEEPLDAIHRTINSVATGKVGVNATLNPIGSLSTKPNPIASSSNVLEHILTYSRNNTCPQIDLREKC